MDPENGWSMLLQNGDIQPEDYMANNLEDNLNTPAEIWSPTYKSHSSLKLRKYVLYPHKTTRKILVFSITLSRYKYGVFILNKHQVFPELNLLLNSTSTLQKKIRNNTVQIRSLSSNGVGCLHLSYTSQFSGVWYFTWGFSGFPQSLEANAGILSYMLPSIPFPVRHSQPYKFIHLIMCCYMLLWGFLGHVMSVPCHTTMQIHW
jgi:hypothetical protein